MRVDTIAIKSITQNKLQSQKHSSERKIVEIDILGSVAKVTEIEFTIEINITCQYFTKNNLLRLTVKTIYTVEGEGLETNKNLNNDDYLFFGELLFLAIAHARTAFQLELNKAQLYGVIIPYISYSQIVQNIANNVYSLWN